MLWKNIFSHVMKPIIGFRLKCQENFALNISVTQYKKISKKTTKQMGGMGEYYIIKIGKV